MIRRIEECKKYMEKNYIELRMPHTTAEFEKIMHRLAEHEGIGQANMLDNIDPKLA